MPPRIEEEGITADVAEGIPYGSAQTTKRIRRLHAFRGRLPAAFKFDRDDANPGYFFGASVLAYAICLALGKAG